MIYEDLRDIIPKRFYSLLKGYKFKTRKYHCGNIYADKTLLCCTINVDGCDKAVRCIIDNSNVLAPSIVDINSIARNGNWVFKYLTLYTVYERLYVKRDNELSALRHALAHKPDNLTNTKTICTLRTLFGTSKINIYDNKQTKIFWQLLCRLVIEIDQALTNRICLVIAKAANTDKA